MDQISNKDVNVPKNAIRVFDQQAFFNKQGVSTVNHHISSVVDADKESVHAFEKIAESGLNSPSIQTKLNCIAEYSAPKDLEVYLKNSKEFVRLGKENANIKLEDCGQLDTMVDKVSLFYGLEDYAILLKMKACIAVNECLTLLVVEHHVCMVVGCGFFIQHAYYKFHIQEGSFSRFISLTIDRIYTKYTSIGTRTLKTLYDYRRLVAAVSVGATGAGALYYALSKPQSTYLSRFQFDGALGDFFKGLSSILVKTTYSSIAILTDVQGAVFQATIGKRTGFLIEFFKDLMTKIKKD